MPKTQTVIIEQPDLFGGPAQTVAVVVAAPPPKPRRVRMTQVKAHRELGPAKPSVDERCRWDVVGNGKVGRTRQEIADRTDIKLQTVCGAVHRLIKQGKLIEPVVGYDANQRPIHYTREGRNVVVNALYADFDWLRYGQMAGHESAA